MSDKLEKSQNNEHSENREQNESVLRSFINTLASLRDSVLGVEKSEEQETIDLTKFDSDLLAQEVKNLQQQKEEISKAISDTHKSLDAYKQSIKSSIDKPNVQIEDIYNYAKEGFQKIAIKYGNQKALDLLNTIHKAGLNPSNKGDAGRIDAIVSLIVAVPPFISRFLF